MLIAVPRLHCMQRCKNQPILVKISADKEMSFLNVYFFCLFVKVHSSPEIYGLFLNFYNMLSVFPQ